MADSSLMHTGETPPELRKGHRTADLGPTDSTDSGSDVVGAPGFFPEETFRLTPGNEEDGQRVAGTQGPAADPGDPDLDSDSDRSGTGERAAADRDPSSPVDQTLFDQDGNAVNGEDIADDSSLDTTLQERDDDAESRADGDRQSGPDDTRGRSRGGGDIERDETLADRNRSDPRV